MAEPEPEPFRDLTRLRLNFSKSATYNIILQLFKSKKYLNVGINFFPAERDK
jgi:hypothetical protein